MITKRQEQLLNFLYEASKKGEHPSYREMADALGLAAVSNITRLVDALVERGYLERIPNRARALKVVMLPTIESVVKRPSKLLEITEEMNDILNHAICGDYSVSYLCASKVVDKFEAWKKRTQS